MLAENIHFSLLKHLFNTLQHLAFRGSNRALMYDISD